MSLTRTWLFRGDLVEARHVLCCPAHHSVSGIEEVERDVLVLPLRGVYRMHLSRQDDFLAEPTQAVFFAAKRPYRISHPAGGGDECLALDFDADVMRDGLATAAGVDRLTEIRTHASLPPAALAGRALLSRRLSGGTADRLDAEETGLALLAAALFAARQRPLGRRPRERTIREWRRQSEVVRELLITDPQHGWTLRTLARRASASPFHLARLFRAVTGITVSEFRLRARLARSLDLLLDTDRDLTAIALDLGFSSHSHFTATFRRAVGVPPADFRRRAHSASLRELRTILIAPLRGRP